MGELYEVAISCNEFDASCLEETQDGFIVLAETNRGSVLNVNVGDGGTTSGIWVVSHSAFLFELDVCFWRNGILSRTSLLFPLLLQPNSTTHQYSRHQLLLSLNNWHKLLLLKNLTPCNYLRLVYHQVV